MTISKKWRAEVSELTIKKIEQSIADRKKLHLSFLKNVKTHKPFLEVEKEAFNDGVLKRKTPTDDGEMSIEFRDGKVKLKAGEMFVVPKGLEHKPFAENECRIMLVEPAGTVNTGDAGGDLTAQKNVWI